MILRDVTDARTRRVGAWPRGRSEVARLFSAAHAARSMLAAGWVDAYWQPSVDGSAPGPIASRPRPVVAANYARPRERDLRRMTQSNAGVSKIVTYRTTLIAVVVVAVGVGLLYVSGRGDWFVHKAGAQTLLNGLAATLITTGGLAILWDLRGKRDIIEMVLAKTKLSGDVQAAGLQLVSMDWLAVPWKDYFTRSREIEIFISYGRSFRATHWESLKGFAQRRENKLYIYLPDPDDELSVNVLAKRYASPAEKIRESILETARDIASLSQMGHADIRVYYRKGDPTYTCYKFDNQYVVTLYSNKRERGNVPTMIIGEGSYHEFFSKDMTAIRSQSQEVPLEQLTKEEQ